MPDWNVQTPVSTIRPTPTRPPAVAAGGASVYGWINDLALLSTGAYEDGAPLTVTIGSRSTLAVFCSINCLGSDSFGAEVQLRLDSPSKYTYWAPMDSVQRGAAAYWTSNASLTGVVTLDAGTYDFFPRGGAFDNSFTVTASCLMTIVVGSNTEQNTFI